MYLVVFGSIWGHLLSWRIRMHLRVCRGIRIERFLLFPLEAQAWAYRERKFPLNKLTLFGDSGFCTADWNERVGSALCLSATVRSEYIYIYIERERETEREGGTKKTGN